jgi:hypothetical protein
MTTNFLAPRNRSVPGELQTEEFGAHAAEGGELADRWHEDSKRRYEELARQWLELAQQRQRCA